MRTMLLGAVLGAALLSPIAANALTAYVDETLTIHAGPGTNFPTLDALSPQTRLWIHGCRAEHDWCDVSRGRLRGWVPADQLALPGRDVAEVPVAGFDIRAYWGENYRREAFYAELLRWEAGRQIAQDQ